MTANVSDERFCETAMKAVILYEDFELVANATALLELVSPPAKESDDEAVLWNVKSYPLDMLKEEPVAQAALMEAVDADLIVLAMHNNEFLPPWMADWLERWAVRRKVEDPDFLVLGRGRDSGAPASAARQVRRLAKRHGLNCICDDELSADDEPAGFSDQFSVALSPELLT